MKLETRQLKWRQESNEARPFSAEYANSNIKIAHLNIRSLKSRESFMLLQYTIGTNLWQITISETWLDSLVDTEAMQILGFFFFRQDRAEHKSGGGLGIYVRDTFKATLLSEISSKNHEDFQQLWIKVQIRQSKSFLICTAYRPPPPDHGIHR